MDGCELRASSRDYDFLVPGSFSPTVMETQRWWSSQTKGHFSTVPQVHGRSRYPTSCTSAGLLFRFIPFIPFYPLLIYTASRRKLRVAAASSHWKEKCVVVQTAGEIISWKLPCGGIQGVSNMRWPGAEPEHSNYIYPIWPVTPRETELWATLRRLPLPWLGAGRDGKWIHSFSLCIPTAASIGH